MEQIIFTIEPIQLALTVSESSPNVTFAVESPAVQLAITPTGETGLSGKSAYAVAVANGFLGSEAEWLLSLKGSIGGISVSTYEHTQNNPALVWSGTHNLNRKITAVYVIDTGGTEWKCAFDSTLTTFNIYIGLYAFAGTARMI